MVQNKGYLPRPYYLKLTVATDIRRPELSAHLSNTTKQYDIRTFRRLIRGAYRKMRKESRLKQFLASEGKGDFQDIEINLIDFKSFVIHLY